MRAIFPGPLSAAVPRDYPCYNTPRGHSTDHPPDWRRWSLSRCHGEVPSSERQCEGVYTYRLYRAKSTFAPSQWETALLCNDVSHWLSTNLESALRYGHRCEDTDPATLAHKTITGMIMIIEIVETSSIVHVSRKYLVKKYWEQLVDNYSHTCYSQ